MDRTKKWFYTELAFSDEIQNEAVSESIEVAKQKIRESQCFMTRYSKESQIPSFHGILEEVDGNQSHPIIITLSTVNRWNWTFNSSEFKISNSWY